MILVDTSVWIDHLFRSDPLLVNALNEDSVLLHPFICGELACGSIKDRAAILDFFNGLPHAEQATDGETMSLMETRKLWARGIGWIDVHLLAAALLSNCEIWTRDKRLIEAAMSIGVKIHGSDH